MSAEKVGSYPFCCLMCETPDDVLRLERSDAAVTWACAEHYETVLADFRRSPSELINVRALDGTWSEC